ncbi:MAG: AAA family ATPase [Methanobrevibacter sp.]|nr:AAA family ATPase [Candidatus Methanovirga basalitermitum]
MGGKTPIDTLDFSSHTFNTPEKLELSLNSFIDNISKEYSINLPDNDLYVDKFSELIKRIYEKFNEQVVILVDEYDLPIIDNLSNKEVLEENKEVLRSFYRVLKN